MIILIIEDDKGLVELIKEKVEECGYETFNVNSAGEALEWLCGHTPYIMLLDYSLPDMNAKELIAELQRKEQPLPSFIVSTGQGDERIAVDMMRLGARDYIIKDSLFLDMLPEVIKRVAREIENENGRKQAEEEREKLIVELREALSQVKTLSGLLPICASCKKIKNDKGYWEQMEIYISGHSEADFSHGICPECTAKLYPEYYKKRNE
jgi:DNA-binding response OmpR family regulator